MQSSWTSTLMFESKGCLVLWFQLAWGGLYSLHHSFRPERPIPDVLNCSLFGIYARAPFYSACLLCYFIDRSRWTGCHYCRNRLSQVVALHVLYDASLNMYLRHRWWKPTSCAFDKYTHDTTELPTSPFKCSTSRNTSVDKGCNDANAFCNPLCAGIFGVFFWARVLACCLNLHLRPKPWPVIFGRGARKCPLLGFKDSRKSTCSDLITKGALKTKIFVWESAPLCRYSHYSSCLLKHRWNPRQPCVCPSQSRNPLVCTLSNFQFHHIVTFTRLEGA